MWSEAEVLALGNAVRKQVKLHAAELQAAPQDCSYTGQVGLELSPEKMRGQIYSRMWGKAAGRCRRGLAIGVRALRWA